MLSVAFLARHGHVQPSEVWPMPISLFRRFHDSILRLIEMETPDTGRP